MTDKPPVYRLHLEKNMRKEICKKIMKLYPAYPEKNNPHLWEIFKTDEYLKSTEEQQEKIRYLSAKASYDYEQNEIDSWLCKYFFPRISGNDLSGKVVLDLGCFTGGRLIAWSQKYQLAEGIGLDINPIFKLAAEEFARDRKVTNCHFFTGFGEELPFKENSIDYIIATDVFEHVKDLRLVLAECNRILRPGGKLLCVFPQYLQPFEAHLGLITKVPALHWLFSPQTITTAYYELGQLRGDGARWYTLETPKLNNWEVLPGLNGISIRRFRKLVDNTAWKEKSVSVKPILTDGRRSKHIFFKLISRVIAPLARLPFLEELFCGRVNYILTK